MGYRTESVRTGLSRPVPRGPSNGGATGVRGEGAPGGRYHSRAASKTSRAVTPTCVILLPPLAAPTGRPAVTALARSHGPYATRENET